MIELPIYNKEGKQVDSLKIDPATLGGEVRVALLKQAYVTTHGNQRQGSARTKSRGSVEGSTRKLYKQKGTGNARVGAARVPNRKGGGVAFAKTRTREDFRSELPKKMRRLANRNALLAKLVDNEVKCIDSLSFKAPKTADSRRRRGPHLPGRARPGQRQRAEVGPQPRRRRLLQRRPALRVRPAEPPLPRGRQGIAAVVPR